MVSEGPNRGRGRYTPKRYECTVLFEVVIGLAVAAGAIIIKSSRFEAISSVSHARLLHRARFHSH